MRAGKKLNRTVSCRQAVRRKDRDNAGAPRHAAPRLREKSRGSPGKKERLSPLLRSLSSRLPRENAHAHRRRNLRPTGHRL